MTMPANVEKLLKNINERNDPNAPAAKPYVVENEMVELKVSELREICDAYPKHPTAVLLKNAVRNHLPGLKVTIEKVQLDAVTQNREVTLETSFENGVEVERKTLAPPPTPEPFNRPPQPRPTGGTTTTTT